MLFQHYIQKVQKTSFMKRRLLRNFNSNLLHYILLYNRFELFNLK